MDFDTIVKKYNNDEATEEEIAFVEDTVYSARRVAKTRLKGDKHVTFLQKVKRVFITLLVICVILATLTLVGWLTVSGNAKENMVITKSSSEQLVYEYADMYLGGSSKVDIVNFKKKLVVTLPFSRSYYLYQYEVKMYGETKYIISIDSYSQLIECESY